MSQEEKQKTASIVEAINKLSDAKGADFTEGLVAGILIGTARVEEKDNLAAG